MTSRGPVELEHADAERWLAIALEALDRAAMLGSNLARHGAATVRGGRKAGRPATFDIGPALARVDELLGAGEAPRHVIGKVAREMEARWGVKRQTVERRLRERHKFSDK